MDFQEASGVSEEERWRQPAMLLIEFDEKDGHRSRYTTELLSQGGSSDTGYAPFRRRHLEQYLANTGFRASCTTSVAGGTGVTNTPTMRSAAPSPIPDHQDPEEATGLDGTFYLGPSDLGSKSLAQSTTLLMPGEHPEEEYEGIVSLSSHIAPASRPSEGGVEDGAHPQQEFPGSSAELRPIQFAHKGAKALTGVVTKESPPPLQVQHPDPTRRRSGQSMRRPQSLVAKIIEVATQQEETLVQVVNGRRVKDTKNSGFPGFCLAEVPHLGVSFFFYRFWIHDNKSRGHRRPIMFLLVVPGGAQPLLSQRVLLETRMQQFAQYLIERATLVRDAELVSAGRQSFNDAWNERNRNSRRQLRELFRGDSIFKARAASGMHVTKWVQEQESGKGFATGGAGDDPWHQLRGDPKQDEAPLSGGTISTSEEQSMKTRSHSSTTPMQRYATGTFPSASAPTNSSLGSEDAPSSNTEPLTPQSKGEVVKARTPTTGGSSNRSFPMAPPPSKIDTKGPTPFCPEQFDFLVHEAFEAILVEALNKSPQNAGSTSNKSRVIEGPSVPTAQGGFYDESELEWVLDAEAKAAVLCNASTPTSCLESLWPLFRPRLSPLHVLSARLLTTKENVNDILTALLQGHQVLVTPLSALEPRCSDEDRDEDQEWRDVYDAHDVASSLASLVPAHRRKVVLGANEYENSGRCNVLTFSRNFLLDHQLVRHRGFGDDNQFVLSEEVDPHSMWICVKRREVVPGVFERIVASVVGIDELVAEASVGHHDLPPQSGFGPARSPTVGSLGLGTSLLFVNNPTEGSHQTNSRYEEQHGTAAGSHSDLTESLHRHMSKLRFQTVPPNEVSASEYATTVLECEHQVANLIAQYGHAGTVYVEALRALVNLKEAALRDEQDAYFKKQQQMLLAAPETSGSLTAKNLSGLSAKSRGSSSLSDSAMRGEKKSAATSAGGTEKQKTGGVVGWVKKMLSSKTKDEEHQATPHRDPNARFGGGGSPGRPASPATQLFLADEPETPKREEIRLTMDDLVNVLGLVGMRESEDPFLRFLAKPKSSWR